MHSNQILRSVVQSAAIAQGNTIIEMRECICNNLLKALTIMQTCYILTMDTLSCWLQSFWYQAGSEHQESICLAGGIGQNFSLGVQCSINTNGQNPLLPASNPIPQLALPIQVQLCPQGTEPKGVFCQPCALNFFNYDQTGCKPCPEGISYHLHSPNMTGQSSPIDILFWKNCVRSGSCPVKIKTPIVITISEADWGVFYCCPTTRTTATSQNPGQLPLNSRTQRALIWLRQENHSPCVESTWYGGSNAKDQITFLGLI